MTKAKKKPYKQPEPLTSAEKRALIKAEVWPLKKAKKPAKLRPLQAAALKQIKPHTKIKKHIAAPASAEEILKALKLSKKERRKIETIVDDVTRTAAKQTVKNWKKLATHGVWSKNAKRATKQAAFKKIAKQVAVVHSVVAAAKKRTALHDKLADVVRASDDEEKRAFEDGQRDIAAEWHRKGATIKSVAEVAYLHGLEAHIQTTPSQPTASAEKPVTLGDAIDLIRVLSYEHPSLLHGRYLIIAREMEKLKLVEHDPTAPHMYRHTERGEQWRDYMKGM